MKLSPEQIEQNGEAVKAHQRGEKVECREMDLPNGKFNPTPEPQWIFNSYTYRPAPKAAPPKPWDMNTCPALPFEILRKDKQLRTIVDFAEINRVGIGYGYMVTYQELLDGYTLTNGLPCGVTP